MFILLSELWNTKQDTMRYCQNFIISNKICVDSFGKLSKIIKLFLKCAG